MEPKEKSELSSIRANDLTASEASQTPDDASLLVKQTRIRRLFTEPQLFAFSASYLITWLGVGSSMYYAFLNGGPVAYLFNYVIVLAGVLAQAASLGELASIQPVAGAQYYWTYRLAPPSSRRFLTWIQGWTTWYVFHQDRVPAGLQEVAGIGYIACLASNFNSNVVILEATIAMHYPVFVVTGWKTFLIIAAEMLGCAFVNMWCFWLIPWFEIFTGVLNVIYFFIYLVTLWVMAPRNPASFVMERSVFSGWDNFFVSWNIGALSQVWLWVGFECIVHMSEESKKPKTAVPRGMFWSVFFNGVVGIIMLFTFMICMPSDIETVVDADSPLVTILLHATGSKSIATALAAGQIIMGMSCQMANFSSATRLTWAWARDGGLPQYFGHVDGRHRVPSRAVALTTALVLLLALLNLGSGTYTALGAITSLSVIGFYVSYAIILAVTLYARYRAEGGLALGEWNLGRAGPLVNAFALLYTCWMLVFLPFPSMLPVTASNMNWSLPAYATIMILAVTLWFVRARNIWPGPNQKVVDLVLRGS